MKQLVKNYTLNTSAKTVTLTDFTTVSLDRLQLIVDVTVNKVVYNFADPTVATATASTNVFSLSALPGGVTNTDHLSIIYDAATGDPTYDSLGSVAQDASIQSLLTALQGVIGTDASAIGSHLLQLGIRGSDGKIYTLNGIGTGDSGTALQVYSPAQGTFGLAAPSGGFAVGFRNPNATPTNELMGPNMDAVGNLGLQSGGTPGSPAPSKADLIAGEDSGGTLRAVSVDSSGNLGLQSSGTAGVASPTKSVQVAGTDNGGLLRPLSATTSGALSIQDASAVPEAPLSINATAFTLGQTGAPSAPITVTTSSTTVLPDSTGVGAINGIAGERDITNFGNVDITICCCKTALWGGGKILRPGGFMATSYSGPISAITQNTNGGVTVGSPVALLGVEEWA